MSFALTSGVGVSYPIVSDNDGASPLPLGLVFAGAVYAGVGDSIDGESIAEINVSPMVPALQEFFADNLLVDSLRHLARVLNEKADEIDQTRATGASETSAFMAAFGPEEGKH